MERFKIRDMQYIGMSAVMDVCLELLMEWDFKEHVAECKDARKEETVL